MAFREVQFMDLDNNLVKTLSEDWWLITAEQEGRANTMPASWGFFGFMWKKPIAACVIRKDRLTYSMVDGSDTFSLTFYDPADHDKLVYCDHNSGRDVDKIKECGFTLLHEEETPYFGEAQVVFICRKVAKHTLGAADFIDPQIAPAFYKADNFHDMFYGEITKVLIREQ